MSFPTLYQHCVDLVKSRDFQTLWQQGYHHDNDDHDHDDAKDDDNDNDNDDDDDDDDDDDNIPTVPATLWYNFCH